MADEQVPVARPQPGAYGIDAPGVVIGLAVAGMALLTLGLFMASATGPSAVIGPGVAGLLVLGGAWYMVWSSRIGKRRLWRRVFDAVDLAGVRTALDVGCGRGLVAVELAKAVPDATVTGVDIWRGRDLSGNSQQAAEINARIEGVEDRVSFRTADMRDLPFPDDSFDVVTAGLAIHNLPLAAERGDAVKEMMRVTKPGGLVLIVDMFKTIEYVAWLRDAAWDDVERGGINFSTYPPSRVVAARRPRRGAAKRTRNARGSGKR